MSDKKKQVEPRASESVDDPVVEVIDEDTRSGSVESIPGAASPASLSPAAPAKPSQGGLRTLGLVGAVAGVGLAVGAQVVEPLAAYQVHSGTLIVGGLVLFGAGVLRRALAGIRSTLDCVSNETLRLEQLALDNKGLQDNVREVRDVTSGLRGDVSSLHEQVEKLVAITSDSDFQTSIFKLAASLDQVGARLDVAMKERFQSVQECLEQMGEQADRSGAELTSKLREMGDALEEQGRTRRTAQEESFHKLQAAAAETHGRLDRSIQALERFDHALAASAEESARERSAGFDELRGHVSQQVEGQSNALHERLDGLEGRFNRVDRDHTSAMSQLAERLERELTARSEALQEGLKAIEAMAGQRDEERDGEIEQQLRGQLESLRAIVQEASRAAGEASSEVGEGIAQLGSHIEQVVVQRYDALSAGLTAVVECATETAVNIEKLLAEPAPEHGSPSESWPAPQAPLGLEVPAEEPPAALPQPPDPGPRVEDPWALRPQPASDPQHHGGADGEAPAPPEHDPLAHPFDARDDGPPGR